MAKPNPLGRTLDQAWDIGQHKAEAIASARLTNFYYTQIGSKRSERIVRDLGTGGSHHGEQGGFTRIGIADQPHISDQAQFEHKPSLLSRFALLSLLRSLAGGGREMDIAEATTTTTGHHNLLTRFDQIRDDLFGFGIADNSAAGHFQDNIFALRTMHLLARPRLAGLSFKLVTIAIIDESVQVSGSFKVDTTTTASIAAVRASKRSKLLAAEVHGAIASITSFNVNFCMVV